MTTADDRTQRLTVGDLTPRHLYRTIKVSHEYGTTVGPLVKISPSFPASRLTMDRGRPAALEKLRVALTIGPIELPSLPADAACIIGPE